MNREQSNGLKLVSLAAAGQRTVVHAGKAAFGAERFLVITGPCAVESAQQIEDCARHAARLGANMLRGGSFKPRTSPYSFQGMGLEGLSLLAESGRKHGLPVVSEVISHDQIEDFRGRIDLLQVGARNMQNYALLKAVGKSGLPVLLKRGFSATIEELLLAAEYILAQGNPNIVLCERGIRSFETETRYTLDISAVPLLKLKTHLPVIVDPSHAAGRSDIVIPLALAARAAGADGIMVEIHPDPPNALSDGGQALNFSQFQTLMERLA